MSLQLTVGVPGQTSSLGPARRPEGHAAADPTQPKTRNNNKHTHLGRYGLSNLDVCALKMEDYVSFLWASNKKKNVHTKVPDSWETFDKSQEVEDWSSFRLRCKMRTVTRSARYKVLFLSR